MERTLDRPGHDDVETTGFALAVRAADGCDRVEDVARLYDELVEALGGEADLLIGYHTVGAADVLDRWIADSGTDHLVGGTSCAQIMTNDAVVGEAGGSAIGLLGIRDDDGDYGSAAATIGDDPTGAAKQAFAQALIDADRPGELPDLVMLHSTTGSEEAIIAAIDELTGGNCPIVGATAANDGDDASPTVVVGAERLDDAVVLTVCFSSHPVSTSFQGGYVPTGRSGHVTEVDGLNIRRIDDRPAAEVYSDWVDGAFDQALADGDSRAFVETKTWCLGREIGQVDVGGTPVPYYALFDPGGVSAENGLEVFVEVPEGQLVHLMTGDAASLPERSGHVIASARADRMPDAAGAVVVYCAGYRFAPEVDLDRVRTAIDRALDGRPFLLTFAFGEQGSLLGGENIHGNLMVSAAVFGRPSSTGL